jgi:integrase
MVESFNPDAPPTPGTFGEIVEQYERRRILPRYKRPKMFATYKKAMMARLGHLKPESMTTAHLSKLIVEYADERGARSGDALRSQLKTCIGWACEMGWMENIAHGLSSKTSGYSYKPRERTLTDAEIRALWHSNASHTPLLRALLLSGLRIGELKLATRADLKGDILRIPAEHSKNGDPHWVYVTPTLRDQFLTERRTLFVELTATGTQAWVKRWCEREGIEKFTPHDLRRTFSTRLNGDLGVAPHVVEKMLNHRMQGMMAVYNRAEYREERVEAYKAWERVLKGIVGGQPNG